MGNILAILAWLAAPGMCGYSSSYRRTATSASSSAPNATVPTPPAGGPVQTGNAGQDKNPVNDIADKLKDQEYRKEAAKRLTAFVWKREGAGYRFIADRPELHDAGAVYDQRLKDRDAIAKWLEHPPQGAAELYYILSQPGANEDEKKKMPDWMEVLYQSMSQWTVRGATPRDLKNDKWLSGFLDDAAKNAYDIINEPKKLQLKGDAMERLKKAAPPAPVNEAPASGTGPVGAGTAAPPPPPYGADVLFGKPGDPNVGYRYVDKEGKPIPLSIRMISVRDDTADTPQPIRDAIVVVDLRTREYKQFDPDNYKEQAFRFVEDGRNQDYKFQLVPEFNKKGGKTTRIVLTDAKGAPVVMADGRPAGWTVGKLAQWRRQEAQFLGDEIAVGGYSYYVMPQAAKYAGYAFLEKNPDGTAGNVALLADIIKRGADGNEFILNKNERNVNLGWVDGEYYHLKNEKGRWIGVKEAYEAPPKPKKEGETAAAGGAGGAASSGASAGGGVSGNGSQARGSESGKTGSQNISDHDDKLLHDLAARVESEIGHDPSKTWAFVYRTLAGEKKDIKTNGFYLLLFGNKVLYFPGVLACHGDKPCIEQQGDDLVVTVAAVEPVGTSVEWVDLDTKRFDTAKQKDIVDGFGFHDGAQKTLIGQYTYSLSVSRVPIVKIKEQPSSMPEGKLEIKNVLTIPGLTETQLGSAEPDAGGDKSAQAHDFHIATDKTAPQELAEQINHFFTQFGDDSTLFPPSSNNRKMLVQFVQDRITEDKKDNLDKKTAWHPVVHIGLFQPGKAGGSNEPTEAARYANAVEPRECVLLWTLDEGALAAHLEWGPKCPQYKPKSPKK